MKWCNKLHPTGSFRAFGACERVYNELTEQATVNYELTVQNEGTRTVERDYLREIKVLDTYAKKSGK